MTVLYETVCQLHFPPAVEKLRFNVRFHKAPQRGGFSNCHMIITHLPTAAEVFGATCLIASRMTGIYHLTRFCGIYAIRCDVDNRVYVGKSYNLRSRLNHHLWELEQGTHDNHFLQETWKRHGASSFSTWIIGECTAIELPKFEHFYTVITKSEDRQFGFNVDGVHPITGNRVLSAATRSKISASNTGRIFDEDTRNKIGEANRGRKHRPRTLEQRERYRKAVTGRKMSDESRAKMSKVRKGRIITPEWRRKISLATKGHPKSPETKLRMKSAQARRKAERIARSKTSTPCQLSLSEI